jgi:hypothetical protein
MTNNEIRENLIKQYQEAQANLLRLEGALALVDEMEKKDQEQTTTEEIEDD